MTFRLCLALTILVLAFPLTSHADPGTKLKHASADIAGSQGPIRWESLLKGDGLDGWNIQGDPWTSTAWSREGDTLIADVRTGGRARIIQGDESWRSYELRVQGTLVKGGALQLWFSIHDGNDHHFATLTGWQTAALIEPDHTKLDVADFIWEYGREYDIILAVRGKSVQTFIDGQLVNRVTLSKQPKGAIGLAVWGKGTIARFRDPQIRHYYRHEH